MGRVSNSIPFRFQNPFHPVFEIPLRPGFEIRYGLSSVRWITPDLLFAARSASFIIRRKATFLMENYPNKVLELQNEYEWIRTKVERSTGGGEKGPDFRLNIVSRYWMHLSVNFSHFMIFLYTKKIIHI